MKSAPNGPGSSPRPLRIEDLQDVAVAEEALSRWDELEPALLEAIAAHPQHGPRLAMLRRADHWLEVRGGEEWIEGECPGSEELYDYGRGPGYGPLPSARRAEIERHLIGCHDCEAIVETLSVPPPVPLESPSLSMRNRVPTPVRAARPTPSPILEEPIERPRFRALARYAPLAMAASLVLALGIWIGILRPGDETRGFPTAPLLRGSSGGPLYYPRERVLQPGPAIAKLFPGLGSVLVFEIEPQADATGYSISIARHGEDAFAVEGEVVAELSGDAPTIRADLDLPPGSYTWTSRVVVRGLSRELGARDFTVVEDPALETELNALRELEEPARSLEAVRILHDRGYVADARAIARAMPASPERDAYLGQVPGR